MLISDLSYLDNISKTSSILGGAILTIDAEASSEGSTLTSTSVSLKNAGKVTIAKGTGTAISSGYNPDADVASYYEGFDKVKVKTRSVDGTNYAFESIRVLAIDRPNQ